MNQEILESLDDSKEELKRAEHLLFVTLKYTRTCEVMKNFMFRLIQTYERGINTLLDYALETKRISQIPVAILIKCNVVREAFPSRELEGYINFYKILRMIYKMDYQKREEYRRHICIITDLTGKVFIETNTDDLYLYFLRTQNFIDFIENVIKS